jgi:hypothetical protein
MDTHSIITWLTTLLITHYIVAIYCIIDMFKWHRMSIKWRFFWIIAVLLNTILMICYFILRKDLHQQYLDKKENT